MIKVSNIKNNPNNPRTIDDDKLEKLKRSIKSFPEMMEKRSMICVTDVDGKLYPLGGNMRLRAIKDLGMKEIPKSWVSMADEWTEEQRSEFIIKDNASLGDWDLDDLQENWDLDLISEWGVDLDIDEVEELEAEEDDFDVELPEEPKTVLGDLYEIGEHRLLCGDSTTADSYLKLMDGELADMIHTDPPYNIGYEGGSKKREKIENDNLDDFPKFLSDMYTSMSTALKKGGAIYVWHASTETHNFIQQFLNSGFLFKSYIIWNKNNSTFGRSDYHWKHEPCIYGWLDGASHKWYGDRKQTTVWDIERPSRSDDHPTMKPIALCSQPLENSSAVGHIILDPFLGSGSTMVASHQLKRKCYGLELDPKYCDVIVNRMLKLDPDLKIKRNGVDITNEWN